MATEGAASKEWLESAVVTGAQGEGSRFLWISPVSL